MFWVFALFVAIVAGLVLFALQRNRQQSIDFLMMDQNVLRQISISSLKSSKRLERQPTKQNALVILAIMPTQYWLNWISEFRRLYGESYDVYLVPDKSADLPLDDKSVVFVDENMAQSNGYWGSVLYFPDRACSRDKALYYLSKTNHESVWVIEDDVFVPSYDTIPKIDAQYDSKVDLLVKEHDVQTETSMTTDPWHWHLVTPLVAGPYAKAMICAIRISSQLLQRIHNYAQTHGKLYLDEALFNTIALQNNLAVATPKELHTIYYRHDWTEGEMNDMSCLYHPVKRY